jgi:hypothetical protein
LASGVPAPTEEVEAVDLRVQQLRDLQQRAIGLRLERGVAVGGGDGGGADGGKGRVADVVRERLDALQHRLHLLHPDLGRDVRLDEGLRDGLGLLQAEREPRVLPEAAVVGAALARGDLDLQAVELRLRVEDPAAQDLVLGEGADARDHGSVPHCAIDMRSSNICRVAWMTLADAA